MEGDKKGRELIDTARLSSKGLVNHVILFHTRFTHNSDANLTIFCFAPTTTHPTTTAANTHTVTLMNNRQSIFVSCTERLS